MKVKQISVMISLSLSLLALSACKPEAPATETPAATAAAPATPAESAAEPAYPTRAYFGDTHVHSGWSGDAGLDGAILSPEDAFRFARGEEVKSNTGQMAKSLCCCGSLQC